MIDAELHTEESLKLIPPEQQPPKLKDTVLLMVQDIRERHGDLAWFSRIKNEAIEEHTITHTVKITQEIVSRSVFGDGCKCPYALALKTIPNVFGAFVHERVAYTLELREGEPVIFKFGVPPDANRRLVSYDELHLMTDHEMAFQPLPLSRTKAGQKDFRANNPTEKAKQKLVMEAVEAVVKAENQIAKSTAFENLERITKLPVRKKKHKKGKETKAIIPPRKHPRWRRAG